MNLLELKVRRAAAHARAVKALKGKQTAKAKHTYKAAMDIVEIYNEDIKRAERLAAERREVERLAEVFKAGLLVGIAKARQETKG